jgi:hypothetical protein
MAINIVLALSFFRHPTTGRRVPESQERDFRSWFKRQHRFKRRRPKKERWLYIVSSEVSRTRKGVKIGGEWHRIEAQYKMTEVEHILPLTSFSNRHIRETFNQHRVFSDIWHNWGGVIRMTVNGSIADDRLASGSRRVREIFHLGYQKEHWESQERGRGSRKVTGRELFRRWLISSVSSNLRRRGLRLSNPKESQGRIFRLHRELQALQGLTEFMKPSEMAGHITQIKWKADAIQKQRKTKQLRGATIRIEKLV